ncbi:hypothetical protein EsH8_VIII_000396 [Colletotrichum jinshuiense]
MQKRHGLFIPSPESLIVEIETLLKYFHLVINEYTECLYCGSIRNTPQAAQQHMTGKGHCRIDIAKEDSEFRDFYDLGSSSDSDDDGSVGKAKANRFVELEKKTRRLESGKILFHRNANKPRNHRTLQGDKKTASESLLEGGHPLDREISTTLVIGGSSKMQLAAAEKREKLFNKQLATLRPGDRQALMHLPLPQQRALVAKAKRQQENCNREQMAQEIKRQSKANP